MQYLVTTDKSQLPSNPIVMVDGTVPGWEPREFDLHFDHHRPGGGDTQLTEIGLNSVIKLPENCVFVTTQVDADACAAAAWPQLQHDPLSGDQMYEAWVSLYAIAHDCDHLGLPAEEKWDNHRSFAKAAVAALKETGKELIQQLGLSTDRRTWTEDQRMLYASESFKRGTEWLVEAAKGLRPYPGERGEAAPYLERMETQRPKVYENCRLYRGCVIFDQRPFAGEYVDPRLLVEWARENNAPEPITLTIRDGSRQPNATLLEGSSAEMFSYTLGSIPLHEKGSPEFSDKGVWNLLKGLEIGLRMALHLPLPQTHWGGRNAVGGSGWRDPVIATPEQVIDAVLT